MGRDGFLLDHLVAVKNLYFQLGAIVQLHGVTVRGVESRYQLVAVIDGDHAQARLLLLGDAADEIVFRKTDDVALQQLGPVRL